MSTKIFVRAGAIFVGPPRTNLPRLPKLTGVHNMAAAEMTCDRPRHFAKDRKDSKDFDLRTRRLDTKPRGALGHTGDVDSPCFSKDLKDFDLRTTFG